MSPLSIRKPVVAGQFYPGNKERLRDDIKKFIDESAPVKEAIGCVMPHAGYMFSGAVAGKTISSLKVKDNIILLGPNHTGLGAAFSIMSEGIWQTTLGDVEINKTLAKAILQKTGNLQDDVHAHIYEHSLEVELPFLQYRNPNIKIVPIIATEANPAIYKEIGKDIALAIKEASLEKSTLIVASSDMTHYEPQQEAERKDKQAIEAILSLDEDKLIQ